MKNKIILGMLLAVNSNAFAVHTTKAVADTDTESVADTDAEAAAKALGESIGEVVGVTLSAGMGFFSFNLLGMVTVLGFEKINMLKGLSAEDISKVVTKAELFSITGIAIAGAIINGLLSFIRVRQLRHIAAGDHQNSGKTDDNESIIGIDPDVCKYLENHIENGLVRSYPS